MIRLYFICSIIEIAAMIWTTSSSMASLKNQMLVATLAAATAAMAAAAVVLQDLEMPQAKPKHRSQYRYCPSAPTPNAHFDLEELDNQACIELFCFERRHIQWLTQLFKLQQAVYLARINPSPKESLCVVLY